MEDIHNYLNKLNDFMEAQINHNEDMEEEIEIKEKKKPKKSQKQIFKISN